MDRFDRIFELNRILQSARRPVSRARLQDELECSRATVKRTIEDMRLYLNAPIVYDREHNGYRYDQAEGEMYELPGLWFNGSELHALLSVQQLLGDMQPGLVDAHLKPLRERIDALLEGRHLGSEGLSGRVRILKTAARDVGPAFQIAAGALALRQRLIITHFNRGGGERTEREVSPQRLVYYRDNWYLDAWCHLREGLRTFALDAVEQARVCERAAAEIDPETLAGHGARSYGIFSGGATQTALLRFRSKAARWVAKERWHRDQQGAWLDDGRYELRIPYGNPVELVMDLLRYGADVEVISPPELRELVAQRLSEAAALYG